MRVFAPDFKLKKMAKKNGNDGGGASIRQFSPRVIVKKELIEVVIPRNTGAPKTKIQLPLVENLRYTHIMGLEVFHFADFPKSIITGSVVISQALMRSIFLTMQLYNGKAFLWYEPIITFHTQDPIAEKQPSTFCGQKVSYRKSYIQIADPTLISTTEDQVVPLLIHYRDYANVEKKDKEAAFDKQS